ncbi:MFS transporter [Flagellatimonas centrodinii]|uniref:MFS transporter n=1 Tax=Flagellatimonas centrodinii TaxID=2806210 RepID=UPI001FED45F4|nr:MFS transporter [Flagellatimonas centrodinii]ULQ47798.1 MFS transporter [Flagellatimonas centrodinii]
MSAGSTRLYFGWWVLAAVFVGEMFAIGSTSYAFGLFVVPAGEAYGASRGTLNTGLILFLLGMGLSAPFIGRLLDRYPARWVMGVGTLAMAAGFVGVGLAPTLQLSALCILLLIGPGAAAIGPLAANTLVTRWFIRHRGKALGLAAVATSLGGVAVVPLMAWNLDRFGWRMALVLQGAIILVVVGALVLWRIRSRPQDLGLTPPADAGTVSAVQSRQWTVGELVRTRDFWFIAFSVGLIFGINQSVLASLVPYATDAGIGLAQATLLVSALSVCSILGKLLFGAVADRYDKRRLLLVPVACTLLQLVTLVSEPSFPVLLVICGLAGFAIGGELPVWAALVGERFGQVSFGTAMGLMSPVNTVIGLLAIGFVGGAFDTSGSYAMPFTVLSGFVVLSGVLTLLISRPPQAETSISTPASAAG